MVDDNTDFSMDRVPVEVALAALQKQVKELQRIATSVPQSTSPTTSSDKVEELHQRIQELEKANAKAEYRIEFLLRALDARDNNNK